LRRGLGSTVKNMSFFLAKCSVLVQTVVQAN
jgi:hypothetical protein